MTTLRRAAFAALCLSALASPAGAVTVKQFYAYPVVPGAASVGATSMNASDTIVGFIESGSVDGPALCAAGAAPVALDDQGLEGYEAIALNDSAQVAGQLLEAGASATHWHIMVTGPNGAGYTDIGTVAGDTLAGATAINDAGQLTGYSSNKSARHAFFYAPGDGAPRALEGIDGAAAAGYAINASGQVAGYASVSDTASHAFLSGPQGGRMKDLGTLGGLDSVAFGVNASGMVTGWSNITGSSTEHAFITKANGKSMSDIGSIGGDTAQGLGINQDGNVVGTADDANGVYHAFVTGNNGKNLKDLTSITVGLSTTLTSATTITDAGHILATGADGLTYRLCPTVNCQ